MLKLIYLMFFLGHAGDSANDQAITTSKPIPQPRSSPACSNPVKMRTRQCGRR